MARGASFVVRCVLGSTEAHLTHRGRAPPQRRGLVSRARVWIRLEAPPTYQLTLHHDTECGAAHGETLTERSPKLKTPAIAWGAG